MQITIEIPDEIINRCLFHDQYVRLATCMTPTRTRNDLDNIELMGRLCYRSDFVGKPWDFVRTLVKNGHLSVLEHASMSVVFTCSRATANQLVRHRLCAFSQESMRYVDFDKTPTTQMTFCNPVPAMSEQEYEIYKVSCAQALKAYVDLKHLGVDSDRARMALPIGAMTKIGVTANLREWLHVFEMRTAPAASAAIRQLMFSLLQYAKEMYPPVFEHIPSEEGVES